MAQKIIRINQIKLQINKDNTNKINTNKVGSDKALEKELEAYVVKTVGKLAAAVKMQGSVKGVDFEISKRSIDSRHKPDIYYIYSVDVKGVRGLAFDSSNSAGSIDGAESFGCFDSFDSFDSFVQKVENMLNTGGSRRRSSNRKQPDFSNVSVNETVKYIFPAGGKAAEKITYKVTNKVIDEEGKAERSPEYKSGGRPVIIGFGPAGMFAALMLAEAGFRPVVYERGQAVDDRIKAVENFWSTGVLNGESNVQFGEGGAGTFSDGKLNTQIKDTSGRIRKVLEEFVRFGAKPEILYVNKPHIGTDVLADIVKNIRNRIIELGGEVHFNSKLTDIVIKQGRVKKVVITHTTETAMGKTATDEIVADNTAADVASAGNAVTEEVLCSCLCLAIGHSARDTFKMLYDKGQISMEAKPFAVGLRLEHPQSFVNYNAYGDEDCGLPAADYKVAYKTQSGRGVYSFCMCPGGYVVNASSENGRLAVNGMSYSGRNSTNANSAIIVTVTPNDFGDGALDGMEFQRRLEKSAYEAADGAVPIQLLGDFKERKMSERLGAVVPCIKGKYEFARVDRLLPEYVTSSIIEGVDKISESFKGFNMNDAVFSGVESRTSSPVRIVRDDEFESCVKGLFPCGEGAGYAGGITSAAVDGIKTAEKMLKYC